MTALFSIDFLKFALPAIGAITAWFISERRKVRWEQFQRKEERYKELLRCLRGFYTQSHDRTLKTQFIDQLSLCWLYAPDHVIRSAYRFVDTIHSVRAAAASDAEKEQALADFVLAIRQDLLSRSIVRRTSLKAAEWRNLTA